MSSKVMFINPDQAKRAIALLWSAKVPANLVGAPGIGKTSAVEQFVETMRSKVKDFGYWPVILAMKGAEDFGMPYPAKEKDKLGYLFPQDIPIGVEGAKGLILFDEWDRCPDAAVQNAAMQFTLGGNFHGTKLSKDVYVALAMNGSSDIYTSPVSEAARTRMCHLYIGTQAAGYWDSWNDWAGQSGVHPAVAGFTNFRRDLFKSFEDFDELAGYNPRTAAMASKILMMKDTVKFRTDDILLPVLAGMVGKEVACEMMAYVKCCDKLPDINEVLRKPETAMVPAEGHVLIALGMALSRRIESDVHAKAAGRYIVRWPREFTEYAVRMIGKKWPAIQTEPKVIAWNNVRGV